MSAATSVALTGVKNSSAILVFVPSRVQADFAQFENRAGGIYMGFDKLTVSVRRPKKAADKNIRVSMLLETPILSTADPVTGAQSVVYRPTIEISATLPERTNLIDRQHIFALARDLIDEAIASDLVTNFEAPY